MLQTLCCNTKILAHPTLQTKKRKISFLRTVYVPVVELFLNLEFTILSLIVCLKSPNCLIKMDAEEAPAMSVLTVFSRDRSRRFPRVLFIEIEFLDISFTKDLSFFAPCYSQSLLLADFKEKHTLFGFLKSLQNNPWNKKTPVWEDSSSCPETSTKNVVKGFPSQESILSWNGNVTHHIFALILVTNTAPPYMICHSLKVHI